MSSVIIARTASEIDRLRDPWTRLYRNGRYTLFQKFEWNLLAARAFCAREQPYVVYAQAGAGAAIIPAVVRPGGLGLLGETLFDYRDVLADHPEALELAWSKLTELELPLEVTAVRNGAARQRWNDLGTQPFCQAPAVSPADISADDFRARHSGIGRHLRRLQRAGGRVCRYAGCETARVRRVLEQKAEYSDCNNLLRDPVRRDFLCGVAAADGEVFALEIGGAMAAGLLTFRDGPTRRFYTITFDRRWATYSPGNALLLEVVRQSLVEGLECDFMTGEQPYKLRFATRNVPLFRVQVSAEELSWAAAAPRAA